MQIVRMKGKERRPLLLRKLRPPICWGSSGRRSGADVDTVSEGDYIIWSLKFTGTVYHTATG